MISPSLLSGLDKGSNMIEFTNLVPFDIAVPGNHEFDAGKENFVERAKQSKYPWAVVNVTNADGSVYAGLGGVMMKDINGVKVALVPIAQDTSPEVASTGDLKFSPSVESGIEAAKKARKGGADLVIAVTQTPRSQDAKLMDSKAFDVILSGDDHELAMEYNGVAAYVETSIDANYLVPIDLSVTVEEKDGKRSVKWEPSFRFIDTANVTPDPETQKLVEGFNGKLIANDVLVLIKKFGTIDAKVEGRITIQQ